MALFGVSMLLALGCVSMPSLTARIHEGSGWVIRLASTSDATSGRTYAHPASLSVATMSRILHGLYLEGDSFAVVDGATGRNRVFSEDDVQPLARFLVEGLQQASATEIVTFVRTLPASSRQMRISSGGIFIVDGVLHFVLANHRVKQAIWNDLEAYEAPIYTQPMRAVVASPGRLGFDRGELMNPAPQPQGSVFWKELPWHVAIRYLELPGR